MNGRLPSLELRSNESSKIRMSEAVVSQSPQSPSSSQRWHTLRGEWFYALILACFAPLLAMQFRQLWLYEHYQYFPILIAGLIFLIPRLQSETISPRAISPILEWVLLFAGLALLAFAVLSLSPNLGTAAFVVTTAGVLRHYFRLGWIERYVSACVALLFLVKLPANLDIDLIFYLQGFTSQIASQTLDVIGVNHLLAGHNIRIPDAGFRVEEACSGIQSLFSLLAMTALFLAYVPRNFVHTILLFATAVFWACMINIVRVVTIVVAYQKAGIDLTTGIPHELLGICLFALAVGLMFSSDQLLLFFTERDNVDDADLDDFVAIGGETTDQERKETRIRTLMDDAATSSALNRWSWLMKGRWILLAGFLLMALAQLTAITLTARGMQALDPNDPRLAGIF